jgi:hypothetical protein
MNDSSQSWLAEAAAAENARFLGDLTHYRAGRSPRLTFALRVRGGLAWPTCCAT